MDPRLQELLARILAQEEEPPPRAPVQAEAPLPFPMRWPQQDWERGSTLGGTVRLPPRPPSGAGMVANTPQEQRLSRGPRPSLMSQYANVVPVQGLMDLGGFVGEQAMRAPGRMMRGEPTNAMPPAEPPPPIMGSPSPMPEQTPPFPFTSPQAMRARLADVQDFGPAPGGMQRQQMPPPRGVEPPSAPRGMSLAEMEEQAWLEAMERAARQRGQPLPTLADVQNRRDGASADRRY